MPRRVPTLVVGWREWVALPELGVSAVRAKLDSGARSSSLHVADVEPRLVVRTTLVLGPWRGPIDLTLTRRDSLGHRMLLGRRALRGRCLVDPSRSYVSGRPGNRRKNARAR